VPGWYKDNARISLNFDEFIAICRQVGAIPQVNVAYNPSGGLGPELAAAWVKYANITKGYGIKYWEIGNEMWKKELNFTTESLASLVKSYSTAMKGIDPTIKIGVSWQNYQAIIDACGSSLDYVTMSDYSGNQFKNYANYVTGEDIKLTYTTASSTKKVIASEYAPLVFGGDSDNNNDTGRGLITFDQTGQILLNKNCEYACYWNTRWYSEEGRLSDVLDPLNNLRATGKALSVWGNFLRNKMVSVKSNNSSIVPYASYDDASGDLNVFIINKKEVSQTIDIDITSDNKYNSNFDVWQYKGTDNFDKTPDFSKTGIVGFVGNITEKLILPATSITVILLKK
jgi:alpha-L-arabinofuranosidase